MSSGMRQCELSQQRTFFLDLTETGHLQSLLRRKATGREEEGGHGQAICSLPFATLHGHVQKMESFPRRSLSRLSLPSGGF